MHRMCRLWAIAAGLVCSVVFASSAQQAAPRGVLILDDSGGAAAGPFYANIISALRGSVNRDPSNQYSIFVEHLDLNRFKGAEYELGLNRFFETKYKARPIAVIVAVGVGALQYIIRSRDELWPAVPVVFTFVDPQLLGRLPADVTGTTFRLKLSDMIVAARAVVPDLDRIALVGDPLKTLVPYRHFQEEIPAVTATGLQIIDLTGLPMRDVRTRVADLPARTAILYPGMYSDGEGTYLTPVEGLRRFADAANRPIIVTADTQLGPGIGGYIAVPSAIGQGAAVQVHRILRGERAAAIPVSEGNFVKPLFDWRQLKRWGISETQLPPDSQVLFRELSAWQRYRTEILVIVAVIVLQTGMIAWLLYEHRRRQSAEIAARTAMFELAQMNRVAGVGELSASIAHEVNQPLAAIGASASAAMNWLKARTPNIDEARAALTQIKSESERAGDIILNLRAMFKKDTQKNGLIEVNKVILSVLDLVRVELQKNRIELRVQLEEGLPTVTGSEVQLQQVVLNLVMNAKDAMQSASRQRGLLITSERSGPDLVQVSIEDSGTGISASDMQTIFRSMFTTKPHGMGMGLSICRSIVEAHGGRIWVASSGEAGTVFRFSLPTSESTARLAG
jgi:signal transduction histidine kinase